MKIYVGNLPYQATEEGLQSAFAAFGNVTSVAILQDRDSGQSRGFGFVEMSDDSEAQAAIDALNGSSFEGRRLTVNEARPPAGRGGGGREGRGGYRDHGGGGRGRAQPRY